MACAMGRSSSAPGRSSRCRGARAARGWRARAAACEAAERAVAEAAKAKYTYFEMIALRDLLGWCEATEAEAVRSRLRSVAGRLVAPPEELAALLGEGVL